MMKRAKSGAKKPAAVRAPAVKHAASQKAAKGKDKKAGPKKAAASKAKKPAAPVKKAPPPPAKAKMTLAKDSGKKAPLKSAPPAPVKKDEKKAAPAAAPSKAAAPQKGAPADAKKAAPPPTSAKSPSAAPGKKDMEKTSAVGKSSSKAGASAVMAKGAAAPIKVEPKIIEAPQQEVRRPIGPLFASDELDHFRQLLVQERNKILAKARQMVEEGAIVVDRNEMLDEVDQAAQMVDQNLTFRLLDRDRKLLSEIDHALLKVENGDYGYCEGTGEPIPKRRLELRPWCRHSVKYKEKLERMEKSGRGVVDEDEIV
jgi:DnaK suppressor protein